MGYNVVVVGVMGNVGCEMFNIFVECEFLIEKIVVLVSCCLLGIEVSFGEMILKIEDFDMFDFIGWDIVLFVVGFEVIKKYVFIVVKQGCVVIDNLLLYCYDLDVLLIVLEVNVDEVVNYIKKNIIVNLNCLIV